jgi:hypothetical protein
MIFTGICVEPMLLLALLVVPLWCVGNAKSDFCGEVPCSLQEVICVCDINLDLILFSRLYLSQLAFLGVVSPLFAHY